MLIAGDPLWTIINFKPLVIKYHSFSSKDVNYHPQKVAVRVCVYVCMQVDLDVYLGLMEAK